MLEQLTQKGLDILEKYLMKNSPEKIEARAKEGDDEAQLRLGLMYYHGEGKGRNHTKAAEWIRKAAEQGYMEAQFVLGSFYKDGELMEQNHEEAAKWLTKAAKQGHEGAKESLKELQTDQGADQGDRDVQEKPEVSHSNDGEAQDKEEGIEQLRKVAEQGNASAQFNLGFAYHNGDGVEQDDAEAVKWYLKAAEQGDEDAKEALEELGAE